MDKNTVRGLILIGLVFIIFMWITPKNEEKATPQQTKAETETVKEAEEALPEILTAEEVQWVKENITETGTSVTTEDGRLAKQLKDATVDLTLIGDSLSGSVTVNGTVVPLKSIITPDSAYSAEIRQLAVARVNALSSDMAKYGKFAAFTSGQEKTVKMQNEVLDLTFSSKGGRLTSATLREYDTEYDPDETKKVKKPVTLFDGATNRLAFVLPVNNEVSTADLYFDVLEQNDTTLLYGLKFAGDAYWGIRYSIRPGKDYVVNMAIEQKGMDKALNSNSRDLGIHWQQAMRRQEQGRMFEERNSGVFYKFEGGDVDNLNENADDAQDRQIKVKWIGFKNQFFSSILISRKPFSTADFASVILNKDNYGSEADTYLKYLSTTATITDYDWSARQPASFDLFLGPNLYPLLSDMDERIGGKDGEDLELTRVIPLGWSIFRWINTWIIIPVFNFLGNFGWNYGIIILLLTIFIKIVLFPLTYKSYKGQAKMRVLAPDIKAINEKYPGQENAMIRQQKTMALYNKAGANPMGGCLPLLLQMPILFAMFSFFPSCIELRGQSFLWCHDLSAPDAIISWSGHIPLVTDYFGNHISLFCLLMTVTNIIYTKINMQSQAGAGAPGMKWMMYLMPVFFMIFFNNYAAGLSYYYFLSLLITILQTWVIRKYVVNEADVRKAMAENAKKPRKKSGFMARLEEAQKKQQEMLKAQQAAQNRKNRRR